MEYNLRAKNILVIGGASGIGLAAAQSLLNAGARHVILASRKPDRLNKAREGLKKTAEQSVSVLQFDISDISAHDALIQGARELTDGALDGMVISSGVDFDGSNWKGFNISESDWDKVMDINLKGVFFLMRTFANYLHSHQIRGNICIVSSISAHRDLLSVYQVTKNAISGIVHTYGKYLVERGVVLNCVEPGTTNTDMMKQLADYTDGVRPGKPWNDNSIRRLIRPEEIGDIICFLMSELGEVMSGACLLAGGGCKSIAR